MAHTRCKKIIHTSYILLATYFLSSIMKNSELSSNLFVWRVIKNNACTQAAVSSTLGPPVQVHRHMDTSKPHTPSLMRDTSTDMFHLPFATD